MAMRAYSLDLRERIVAAVAAGETHPVVARRFGVAVATVANYLRLRRATGRLAPRPRPGGQPEIAPARHPQLLAQLRAAPDATLAQHCATWAPDDVCIWDEAGTNVARTPKYARAPRNERAHDQAPCTKGDNSTTLAT